MLDLIWTILSDLVDLPLGRKLFGKSYRQAEVKTPQYQLIISCSITLGFLGLVAGVLIWLLVKIMS